MISFDVYELVRGTVELYWSASAERGKIIETQGFLPFATAGGLGVVTAGAYEGYTTLAPASVTVLQNGEPIETFSSGFTTQIDGLAVDTPYTFGLLVNYPDGTTEQSRQINYQYGSTEVMYVDPEATPIVKALEAASV